MLSCEKSQRRRRYFGDLDDLRAALDDNRVNGLDMLAGEEFALDRRLHATAGVDHHDTDRQIGAADLVPVGNFAQQNTAHLGVADVVDRVIAVDGKGHPGGEDVKCTQPVERKIRIGGLQVRDFIF